MDYAKNAETLKAAIMAVPFIESETDPRAHDGDAPGFTMVSDRTDCGTPRCIGGHCSFLLNKRLGTVGAAVEYLGLTRYTATLLCYPKGDAWYATNAQACHAIDRAVQGLEPWGDFNAE